MRIGPITLCLALALSPACAQDAARRGAGPFPHLKPATVDAAGALEAAAHALFRPARGTWLELRRTALRTEHALGAELETWSCTAEDGSPAGTFQRLRAWPAPDSTVDLALRVEDGRIRAAVPVRPLVVGGAAFPALVPALALAPEVPASAWAPAVAVLVRGLADLEACMSGRAAAAPLDADAAQPLVESLERARPPLLPGARFPALEAKDERGAAFGPAACKGQATLVVCASVKHGMSRGVIDEVNRYVRAHPARFRAAWVLADRPAAIAAYRARGGELEGLVVPDAAGTVRDALRVAVLPSLFAFDVDGKLQGFRRAPWPAPAAFAEFLDQIPIDETPTQVEVRQTSKERTAETTLAAPVVADPDLRAAWRRLPPPPSATTATRAGDPVPRVTRTLERYSAGTVLERIELVGAGDEVVDTLARAVAQPDARTRLDVLVRPDGGAALACEPLAPPRAAGHELTHLRALVAAIAHRGMDTHGPALARLFEALAVVGTPVPAPRPVVSGVRLSLESPGLAPGTALPDFEAPDREGHLVRARDLAGAPALLVLCATDPPLALDLVAEIQRTAAARHAKTAFVTVEPGTPLAALLPAPHLPYLYLLDARARVTARAALLGSASARALLSGTP